MRQGRELPRAGGRRLLLVAALLATSYLVAVPAFAAPPTTAPTAAPTQQAQTQGQQPAATQPADDCAKLSGPAKKLCDLAKHPGGAVSGAVGGAAAGVVSTAGDSALRSFTAAVASAGKWFLDKVGGLLRGTTSPNVVDAGWFVNQYRVMLALAILIALPVLLVSVAQSIVRVDMMQAVRSAVVYLPIAAIFSAVAPAIVQILIDASDWLSSAITHSASASAQQFMTDTGGWLGAIGAGTANPAVPVFGVLLGAMVVVLGAFSIWLELLLRSAAIYIAVLFLPIGLSAMIWPSGWRWCKRLIDFLIAIIFAKVFIVAIINLAASGLAQGGFADKFEGVLAGGALLLMAAFTPIALLRLIPLAEAAVVSAGQQRAALRQATQGATAFTGTSVVSQMIQSRFRGTGSGAASGASGWAGAAGAATSAASSAVSGARQRVDSGFGAMTGEGSPPEGGARPVPPPPRPEVGPVPSSNGSGSGGNGFGGAMARPLKLPELAPEGGVGSDA
jgi:hypothetical protein